MDQHIRRVERIRDKPSYLTPLMAGAVVVTVAAIAVYSLAPKSEVTPSSKVANIEERPIVRDASEAICGDWESDFTWIAQTWGRPVPAKEPVSYAGVAPESYVGPKFDGTPAQ